jgi:hypothetical protein
LYNEKERVKLKTPRFRPSIIIVNAQILRPVEQQPLLDWLVRNLLLAVLLNLQLE